MPTRPEQFRHGSREDIAQRLALLRRALVSVVDFREAMSSWSAQHHVSLEGEHHGESLQESVVRALRSASIVAYARPFLGSNTPPGSPQRRDRLFLEDIGYKEGVEYSKWWLDLHNVILTLRDKFIAHADTDMAGRNPAVRARLEHDGDMEVQVEINNYYEMLEGLENDRVWRLFDIVENNTQQLAYRLAEELISEGHLQNSDLKPDERPSSLLLQLRREMPPTSAE